MKSRCCKVAPEVGERVVNARFHEFKAVIFCLFFTRFAFSNLFFGAWFSFGSRSAVTSINPIGYILRGYVIPENTRITRSRHEQ